MNKPTLVIVGFSFAGRMLLNTLLDSKVNEKAKIIVIDKSDTFEFICTSYKALVNPDEINRLRVPVQETIDKVYK